MSSTLTSITITPNSEELTNGTTATLSAIGNYSNGTTADLTTMVTWTSSIPTTASVGMGTGVVTCMAVGTTTITASMPGLYSMITSPPASITVTAATLSGITISPLTMSVARGGTTSFTANGAFSDSTNGNISGAVTWSSSDTTIATINTNGTATGVGMGNSTISASLSGITTTATLTVF